MNFNAIVDKIDNKNWSVAIIVPEIIAQPLLNAGAKRFNCTLNGDHTFPCALLPNKNGGRFIILNAAIRKKYGLGAGSQVNVTLEEDKSEYGMPVPDEIIILWEQDELFHKNFHALTPGKQRNILHYVGKYKSEEKRIQKAIQFAKHLELNQGILDFQMMNKQAKEGII